MILKQTLHAHCFQGPYQGPLAILQKGHLMWFDPKVEKNTIRMIICVRVHQVGVGR